MLRGEPITLNCCWFSMTALVAGCFGLDTLQVSLSVKYVWYRSLNLGSAISNNHLHAGSSTTLRGCKPRQMKFVVASTSCLCFTLSFENGVDLASVPLIVSCVDAFTTEALLGLGQSSLSCCVTLLKVGLQIKGVARVRDDSLAKSANGLLLVCNLASIDRRKTKVLPDSTLCLKAWFHDLVEFVHSQHLCIHTGRR